MTYSADYFEKLEIWTFFDFDFAGCINQFLSTNDGITNSKIIDVSTSAKKEGKINSNQICGRQSTNSTGLTEDNDSKICDYCLGSS